MASEQPETNSCSKPIPTFLLCPFCKTLPEAEVYQCCIGHVFCKQCFERFEVIEGKWKRCPREGCEQLLPTNGLLNRNLFFEKMMDDFEFNCKIKSQGCKEEKLLGRVTKKQHEEIPEDFLCPSCKTLPEAEIFQCPGGHILCKFCYDNIPEEGKPCPRINCQLLFSNSNPVSRNLFAEKQIDKHIFNCQFQSNGCSIRLNRTSWRRHQHHCYFNFEKYGRLKQTCREMGYSSCAFAMNEGNSNDAVGHFASHHHATITSVEGFELALQSFRKDLQIGPEFGYRMRWQPIIVNLPEKKCWVFLKPSLTYKWNFGSFSFQCLYLPYPDNLNLRDCPVELEFSVLGNLQTTGYSGNLRHRITPISSSNLPNFVSYEENLALGYQDSWWNERCSVNGTLAIFCQIKQKGFINTTNNQNGLSAAEKFTLCQDPNFISPIPMQILQEEEQMTYEMRRQIKISRSLNTLPPFLYQLFDEEEARYITALPHKQTLALFLVVELGTATALRYMIQKGVKTDNLLNGFTAYDQVMLESDPGTRREKARLLAPTVLNN